MVPIRELVRLGMANPPSRQPGKSAKVRAEESVPQTDTGGQDEYSQALG